MWLEFKSFEVPERDLGLIFTQQCGSSSAVILHPLSLSTPPPIMVLADFRVSHLCLWQAIIKVGVTYLKSQVNLNLVHSVFR